MAVASFVSVPDVKHGLKISPGILERANPDNQGCIMTGKSSTQFCDRTACSVRIGTSDGGWCSRRADGICRQNIMRGPGARLACLNCICTASPKKKKRPNQQLRIATQSGRRGLSTMYHIQTRNGAQDAAKIGDFIYPGITSWISLAQWLIGRRMAFSISARSEGFTGETIRLRPLDSHRVPKQVDNSTAVTVVKYSSASQARIADISSSDSSVDTVKYDIVAAYDIYATPINLTMTITARDDTSTKRWDWSQINFQYWAEVGNRWTDVTRDSLASHYQALLHSIADTQGACVMITDYESYWATAKIWTGTAGPEAMGNCQCASSDFWDLEGDSCGGSGEDF